MSIHRNCEGLRRRDCLKLGLGALLGLQFVPLVLIGIAASQLVLVGVAAVSMVRS